MFKFQFFQLKWRIHYTVKNGSCFVAKFKVDRWLSETRCTPDQLDNPISNQRAFSVHEFPLFKSSISRTDESWRLKLNHIDDAVYLNAVYSIADRAFHIHRKCHHLQAWSNYDTEDHSDGITRH